MNRRFGFAVLGVALLAVVPASAYRVETRRATMNGRGGDWGKCTIEVEVDGAADVELFGDTGRLRTLAGSPAFWRRFECNGVLPRNPADFRFSGIDGRGRQTLMADPRGNGGVAVVRLEDPKGGREGYTFDVEWRGGYDRGARGYEGPRGYEGGPRGYEDDGYGGSGRVVAACQDAVRDVALRDYGLRNLRFSEAAAAGRSRSGAGAEISGFFEAGGRGRMEEYRYSCQVDRNNGRLRSVDLWRR